MTIEISKEVKIKFADEATKLYPGKDEESLARWFQYVKEAEKKYIQNIQ